MAYYAILRFSKRKAGGVASADRHNERKKAAYKSNPDINKQRSKENYHLIKPEGSYKREYTRRIDEAGCKVRSNSVVMVETLITASPEFINKMDPAGQKQFFERSLDFISSRVGKNNIISAIIHMDETTPHMHLTFCPVTNKGRLSAKEIVGNRQALSEWQDQFYGYMCKFYPELSRGLPSVITGRKHIPNYLFKQAAELSKSYEIIEKLGNTNIFNVKSVTKETMHEMSHLIKVCTSLSAKTKEVDDYISNLEKTIQEQKATIDKQDSMIEKRDEKNDDLLNELMIAESNIKELQSWQRKAQEFLAIVPPEMRAEIDKMFRKGTRENDR